MLPGQARCAVELAEMSASRTVAAMRCGPQSSVDDVWTLMAAVEASVLVRAQPVAHSALPLSSRDMPAVRIKTNAKEFGRQL